MATKKHKGKTPAAEDYIKAARKGSREAELSMYGKPLPKNKVHKSKKVYDRKRSKAGTGDLPFDLEGAAGPVHGTGVEDNSLAAILISMISFPGKW